MLNILRNLLKVTFQYCLYAINFIAQSCQHYPKTFNLIAQIFQYFPYPISFIAQTKILRENIVSLGPDLETIVDIFSYYYLKMCSSFLSSTIQSFSFIDIMDMIKHILNILKMSLMKLEIKFTYPKDSYLI